MPTIPEGGHTPGPWRAYVHGKPEHDNEQWLVVAVNRGVNDGDSLICEVNTLDRSDARLIAAAPDLLEALKKLVAEANRLGPQLPYNTPTRAIAHAIEDARAAITLATGSAQ